MQGLGNFEALACSPPKCTVLFSNGLGKTKVVVVGDGFTAGDQGLYSAYVFNTIVNGVFTKDFFEEEHNAFNLYRINLVSAQSGVTHQTWNLKNTSSTSDDTLTNQTVKNTALKMAFTGQHGRCWIEFSSQAQTLLNQVLADNGLSSAQHVVIVLNEPSFGGCKYSSSRLAVTKGVGWDVIAHEFGHAMGGLADEYDLIQGLPPATYTGGEPAGVNCTKNSNKGTLKWKRYVKPTTPVPTTTVPAGVSPDQHAGLFQGCSTFKNNIFRPTLDSRMKSNSKEFGPVSYNHLKNVFHAKMNHSFLNSYVGDFTGDGKDDVVIHNGDDLALYESTGNRLQVKEIVNNMIPSWEFRPGDKFLVGDFNGDGKDDLLVTNWVNWPKKRLAILRSTGAGFNLVWTKEQTLDGIWGDFDANDRFLVGDFTGDGKDDVVLYNMKDFQSGYVGLYRAEGSGLTNVFLYGGAVGPWQLKPNDQLYLTDYTGDGKKDVVIFNTTDWAWDLLGLFRSDGTALSYTWRHDGGIVSVQPPLAGIFYTNTNDKLFFGDFDGDGKEDAYIYNNTDWGTPTLGMLKSVGTAYTLVARYDGGVPSWNFGSKDQVTIGDVNGDKKADLVAHNAGNFDSEYLGVLYSSGTGLTGAWLKTWVGEWKLSAADVIRPVNYRGLAGRKGDLFILTKDWFGLLRNGVGPMYQLDYHYQKWIHNEQFGRWWYP